MTNFASQSATPVTPNARYRKTWPFFLLGLLFGFSGLLTAQEAPSKIAQVDVSSRPVLAAPGEIKGRLLDVDGITPHEKIKIKLIRLPDETLVSESITDQAGRYAFLNVPAGEYNLQIGETLVRLLAAEGLAVQPIHLVVPKFLLTASAIAPGVASAATAPAIISWTTAAWTGGTLVVVGGGVVGVAAATDNLGALGLGDDEAVESTVPTTPPSPPGSPS